MIKKNIRSMSSFFYNKTRKVMYMSDMITYLLYKMK
jgi:hypothetical protein